MILLADAVLLGVVLGWAVGGRLSRLGSVRLRHEPLLLALLVLQLSIPQFAARLGVSRHLGVYLWLLAMAALVIVAGVNRVRVGILLLGLGVGLNAFVIALNGAMPVSEVAVSRIVGYSYTMPEDGTDILHEPLRESTAGSFLADVIPLPGPRWHRGVISIGDILIAAGAAVFVCQSMRDGSSTP